MSCNGRSGLADNRWRKLVFCPAIQPYDREALNVEWFATYRTKF